MWQYLVLLSIPFILQSVRAEGKVLVVGCKERNNSFSMIVFWIFLFFLLILRRNDVGCDVRTYEFIFNAIRINDWNWAVNRSPEIGWNLLNKVVTYVTTDFRWIIIISAFLSVCLFSRAFLKYSTDTILSIVIYINTSCFVLLFSGLRQCIAISICTLAFEFANRRKLISFFLCTAVAMTFHISAFMILFIYPLCNVRLKKKHLIFIIPLLLLIFVFNKPIFSFLGTVLSMFTDYDTTITYTGSYTMLFLLLLFAIFSFMIPNEKEMDNETIAMRNILLFSLALQMFAPLHTLAMRMNYYFIVFVPLLIPRIIDKRKDGLSQVAIVSRYIMILFFAIYFIWSIPKGNVLQTFPYYFFWE